MRNVYLLDNAELVLCREANTEPRAKQANALPADLRRPLFRETENKVGDPHGMRSSVWYDFSATRKRMHRVARHCQTEL